MKTIITILSLLSLILTAVTCLNLYINNIEDHILFTKQENIKLKHQLNFLQSEWEYISSPENIQELALRFFELESINLIDKNTFLEILDIPSGEIN